MPAITKLRILFTVDEDQSAADALQDLPGYVKESFVEHLPGEWHGDFEVTCPVAPKVADGDFVDDLAPYFPALLKLHKFYDASFELQISVGPPGPEDFELSSSMVAMIAALGANLIATTSTNPHFQKSEEG